MEENKEVPLIRFTDTMKPQVVADNIIEAINSGNLNALEVAVGLKKLKKVIDKVFDSRQGNKDCREARDKEAQLYAANGPADAFGAKVSYTATKTSYDYAECAHPKWAKLSRIAKQIKSEMDSLQKELVKIPSEGKEISIDEIPMLTWEASGEMATIYPPTKKQAFGTKITL